MLEEDNPFYAKCIALVPPRISPFTFGSEAMSYGEFVNVQCTVSGGDVPLNISWTLDNRPFDDYLEVFTTKRGKRINELTIESVAAKHVGNYTCIAINRAGIDNFTAPLRVNGLWSIQNLQSIISIIFLGPLFYWCFFIHI